jgi:hypothetical protein
MNGPELWFAGILLLFVLAIFVLGLRVRIMSQKKRLVVYRLGSLHRIIGPGIVWWYALIDREVSEIEIQEVPFTPFVDGTMVNGLSVSLTVNLWFAFNPAQAIGPGRDQKERERLVDLLKLPVAQREEQALVHMREQLGRQLAVLAGKYPLPPSATVIAQLMPILPGTPQRHELMKNLHAALKGPLAEIGYVLSDREITVVHFYPPQDLISSFSRNRIIAQIQENLPELSDETIAQIIASIEGREQMNVQKLVWEGNIPPAAHLEYQPDRGILRQKMTLDPKEAKPDPDPSKEDPSKEEELSSTDLAVLKRIPPAQQNNQASA